MWPTLPVLPSQSQEHHASLQSLSGVVRFSALRHQMRMDRSGLLSVLFSRQGENLLVDSPSQHSLALEPRCSPRHLWRIHGRLWDLDACVYRLVCICGRFAGQILLLLVLKWMLVSRILTSAVIPEIPKVYFSAIKEKLADVRALGMN